MASDLSPANRTKSGERTAFSPAEGAGNAVLTTTWGAPVDDDRRAFVAGPMGPLLMQDAHLLDKQAKFDRERIPERVVHAKGAGAHGYFEVTHDITRFCKADMFSSVGKRTPVLVRFSRVTGFKGASDAVRDLRGFAIKHYTDEGIWDLVANNTPIFFIRDPAKFPDLIHSLMPHPANQLADTNTAWDFLSFHPESLHQVLWMYGPRGIPASYRTMQGFGSHAFKTVNAVGQQFFVKFHYKSEAGVVNLTQQQATSVQSADVDHLSRDLYEFINGGNEAVWNLFIQVMPAEDVAKLDWSPFDVTKVWFHRDYPLIPVGRLVLNRNAKNYFAEIEQAAFAPSRMVPGIEVSPDPILQSRIFAYPDTQFHRLGANFMQIPVNCPLNPVHSNSQDGPMCILNRGSTVNYSPTVIESHPQEAGGGVASTPYPVGGTAARHGWVNVTVETDMVQPRLLWNSVFSVDDRKECAQNMAISLSNVRPEILERQMLLFRACDPEIERAVRAALELMPSPPTSHVMKDPETLASKQSPARESLLLSIAGGILKGLV